MDKSYKRKNYYKPTPGGSNNWNNRKPKNYLTPGMKGFICTCNTREKDCVKESYNILNEYADKIMEQETPNDSKMEEKQADLEGGGDIQDELKREVSSLKSGQRSIYRFSTADTGVKNNIFVKTTLEDPVKLAVTILNDIAETKTQKARFLMRIVPVEVTCRANIDDIKKAADELFEKHFRCEPTTFAVVINKRYNDSLLRDEVIHALALLVTDRNREHKADLKNAKLTVLLEVMKGVCCMSVLEDYKRLRHYNIAELAKPVEPEADGVAKHEEGLIKTDDAPHEEDMDEEAPCEDKIGEDICTTKEKNKDEQRNDAPNVENQEAKNASDPDNP